ncbi:MAG: hypothetical protein JWR69_223 [Pedosphaera sp.]|nr:hypothetical protein [Pedosphaera sp.]
MNDERLEIQKRHTLNWLIQGAAQHAGMTFHHLVRDELNALDPRLVGLYDQYALINLLQYWQVDGTLLLGWPPRFWRRASSKRNHPFFGHPLLSKYGGTLAEAGRQRALARCNEKGLTRLPIAFSFQVLHVIEHLRTLEAPHRPQLVQLAKGTASMVWEIPQERLDGELSSKIVLEGGLLPARCIRGAAFRAGIVGYGGVVQRGDNLMVVGKGTNWQLLAKELVKGTAELICLHGLSQLGDDMYRRVLDVTDRLDLEPWMLQSGGELWRRLLASLPDGLPVAKVLMHLARLPAGTLESMVAAVIEQPEGATGRLASLAI